MRVRHVKRISSFLLTLIACFFFSFARARLCHDNYRSYIVMLLFLVIYLFAIMGCLFFGVNDTARFGTVPTSMLSLFQVSTLASWTSIAYTSW